MSVEHASDRLIARYTGSGTDLAADEAWALEAHLEQCAACRNRLATVAGELAPEVAALVEDVWSQLGPVVAATAPMPLRRRSPGRLPAWASPAMVPWTCMTLFLTLLAVVFDVLAGGVANGLSPVLVIAPVLPVLGVAVAWTRGMDPVYELAAATPRAGLPLLLRRTTSVLLVVIPALLVAGWLTGTTAALWLLPSLAFTTATLALGGLIGASRAAIALVTVWAAVIVLPSLAFSRAALVLWSEGLPVWAALIAAGALVVAARRGAYTTIGAHH